MKRNLVFKTLFSVLLLIILIYKIGAKELISNALMANLWYIPLVVLTWVLLFFIGALNFSVLLRAIGYQLKFGKMFSFYLMSWSIGLVVPGKIGEFSIAYFLNKKGIGYGKGLAVASIDKFITILTLILISSIGSFVFLEIINSIIMTTILWGVFAVFIFGVLYSEKFLKKHFLRNHLEKFDEYQNSFKHIFKFSRQAIFINSFLTLFKWIVSALGIMFLFSAFNLQVPYMHIFLLNGMITILSLIPITMNGLGLKEAGAVYLFSKFTGAAVSAVAGAYIIGTALTYIIAVVGVLFARKA
jgi:glycosyltransferase 2 family protein